MNPPKINTDRDAEIVGRRAAGETYLAIAKRFGLSKSRVNQIWFKAIRLARIREMKAAARERPIAQ